MKYVLTQDNIVFAIHDDNQDLTGLYPNMKVWQTNEIHELDEQVIPQFNITKCTKYQLVTTLRNKYPTLFEELKQAYASDSELQFYWNTVNDLDRENLDFKSIVGKLDITSEQLTEIFNSIADI